MTQYLYRAAYTPESLATQIKNPSDRIAAVGAMIEHSIGAKITGGGFAFGEYDIAVIVEASDDTEMAAVAIAIASGGAIRSSKTTRLLSGDEWIAALEKSSSVSYSPAS